MTQLYLKRAEKENSYNILIIFLSLRWILCSLLFSSLIMSKNNVKFHFYIMSHKEENMNQNVFVCDDIKDWHKKTLQTTNNKYHILPSLHKGGNIFYYLSSLHCFHLTSLFQYLALSSKLQTSFRAFTAHWVTLCFMKKESFFTFQLEIFCQMLFSVNVSLDTTD